MLIKQVLGNMKSKYDTTLAEGKKRYPAHIPISVRRRSLIASQQCHSSAHRHKYITRIRMDKPSKGGLSNTIFGDKKSIKHIKMASLY